jgi:hypothetical protein
MKRSGVTEWHLLVQPGPMGDPAKKAKRLAARILGVRVPPPPTPRLQRPGHRTGGYGRGRLVLHRAKPARPSGVALASPNSLTGKAQRVDR